MRPRPSACWSRPSLEPSTAHPDDASNTKARSLAYYGRGGLCAACPNHLFDYFFWIDFAGVHQDGPVPKTLGIAKLPLYVAVAVEICFFHSKEYEARAWTRLERALGFVFCLAPMFVMINDEYLEEGRGMDLEQTATAHSDCFSLDGGGDEMAFSPLVATGGLLMHIHDPLSPTASATQPSDRALIQKLVELLKKAKPVNIVLKSVLAKSGSDTAFLDFTSSKIAVDTDHYRMDCEVAAARHRKRAEMLADAGVAAASKWFAFGK
jgi:hypothetical protein